MPQDWVYTNCIKVIHVTMGSESRVHDLTSRCLVLYLACTLSHDILDDMNWDYDFVVEPRRLNRHLQLENIPFYICKDVNKFKERHQMVIRNAHTHKLGGSAPV